LGQFDITHHVLVSDGSGVFVDSSSLSVLYIRSEISFQISFDTAILPSSTTLDSMTISQTNGPICTENCVELEDLQFVCNGCEDGITSPGATFNMSLYLSPHLFSTSTDSATATTFEFGFAFDYSGRRQLVNVQFTRLPVRLELRDYDCLSPNGNYGGSYEHSCASGGFAKYYCVQDVKGWVADGSCSDSWYTMIGMIRALSLLFAGFILALLYSYFGKTKDGYTAVTTTAIKEDAHKEREIQLTEDKRPLCMA